MAESFNKGLARSGIIGRGTGATILADVQRGWQLARRATADESATGDMTGVGAGSYDAVQLPPEGRVIMIRAASVQAGTVVAQIILVPAKATADDPNDSQGAEAGWQEAAAQSFTTTTAQEALEALGGVETDMMLSDYILIDRKGADYLKVRITTVANNGEASEIQYRVF